MKIYFNTDHLASDDPAFLEIMQATSQDITLVDGTSSPTTATLNNMVEEEYSAIRDEKSVLKKKIALAKREVADAKRKLENLEEAYNSLEVKSRELEEQVHAKLNPDNGSGSGSGKKKNVIDYANHMFIWDTHLRQKMRDVFGIKEFRLCQRGVCNANMDGRDIVVVMPTGGGKSLTYQLPAILHSGVTLVISPLLSLISDQIMHLRNANVEAVKFTGSTSKSEQDSINARLNNMAMGRGDGQTEIKLLYCTPEKIAKSKHFLSLLQKLADGGKLARVVIDEAHCVSQIGHDFRPDYAKLHVLRQLFPHVPIMALSATCPPAVLADLLKVLKLKKTVPGEEADTDRSSTVYFTSPLYRPNLHYQILPKAAQGDKVYEEMAKWILDHHKDDSGIVYCLSKKDSEKVAAELSQRGGIRTGVYHADKSDGDKERLHQGWQNGVVKVVCATIAFGLGIDKGDVRFVIHHSISKSLDGFYQESGRAGRDGKDSDCVLYYRAQDAATLSAMAISDHDGTAKLHPMLKFAQELRKCRKIQFAEYFNHTSQVSMTSWSTSDLSAKQPCGHCDNCTRPPESYEHKDVTYHAWQLIKIVEAAERNSAKVTLAKVADLARSTGKGTFSGGGGGKRGRKSAGQEQIALDLDSVAGGKVELKREDIESLLVELLLKSYLKEQLHSTAYATVAYIQLGRRAHEIIDIDKDQVNSLSARSKIWCTFRVTKKTRASKASSEIAAKKTSASSATGQNRSRKGKEKAVPSASISDDDGLDDKLDDDFRNVVKSNTASSASGQRRSRKGKEKAVWAASISDDDGLDDDAEQFVFKGSRNAVKLKSSTASSASGQRRSQKGKQKAVPSISFSDNDEMDDDSRRLGFDMDDHHDLDHFDNDKPVQSLSRLKSAPLQQSRTTERTRKMKTINISSDEGGDSEEDQTSDWQVRVPSQSLPRNPVAPPPRKRRKTESSEEIMELTD